MKYRLLAMLLGFVFIALMVVFAMGLNNNPNVLDLATKGQKIPAFNLPALQDNRPLTLQSLRTKKPYYLINVWGSWCPACYQEHPYLMQLAQQETIYGVNWKDNRDDALAFLKKGGNPFKAIIVDDHSVLAIGMGVYGAPETFLIAADGTIHYRHAGPLTEKIWQAEFLPYIERLGQ